MVPGICLPVQEMSIQPLSQEYPLEQEMATHSCILAWKTPWTEEPGGLQCNGVAKSWTQLSAHTHTHTHTTINIYVLAAIVLIVPTEHSLS